jgi:Rad3-related DNA helicase
VSDIFSFFPSGKAPRPQQVSAIKQVQAHYDAGKKIVVVEMPTGGGKSFVAQTFADEAISRGGKAFMITIQNILLPQYTKDFPQIKVLKGRSHYACTHANAGKDQDADNGVCKVVSKSILPDCVVGNRLDAGDPYIMPPIMHLCPYWKAASEAREADESLFTFDGFLSQQRANRFGHREFMVVDEAHNIEGKIEDFVSVEISEKLIAQMGVDMPLNLETVDQVIQWSETEGLSKKAHKMLELDPPKYVRKQLDALTFKLDMLSDYAAWVDWVVDYVDNKRGDKIMKCRPLSAAPFADDLLFSKAGRVLAMSATILNQKVWAESLGLAVADVGFVTCQSEFPKENRPIHLSYCGNMSFKYYQDTKPSFIKSVRGILQKHGGERGIIHCHTFNLQRDIRELVNMPRLLFQQDFKTKDEMLVAHAASPNGVIVAPAMHEGLDLFGDLSRFQIICKVPWPDLKDKVVKAKADKIDGWYAMQAALKFVQSYGRSVRSSTDWAKTYMLDSGFTYFMKKNGHMIPTWVTSAITSGGF